MAEENYGVVPRDELQDAALERFMASKVSVIVIEDNQLSGRVASSIQVGNLMHKTAVLASLGCLVGGAMHAPLKTVLLPLGGLGLLCGISYDLGWQDDPMAAYQVLKRPDAPELTSVQLPAHLDDFTVLVRRDDSVRRVLHNTLMLAAGAFLFFRWRRI
ncbi:uncharacterized protein MONBRDRAFT_26931 [Monosiga brevicollis MX1]|uniref:Uncharacterized protein n=1 Tax=Monosiga brevicollis TaxID=81824 RepID=A9V3Y5_MONBE|nr:uncharacterized protein MONBRDRAFT_26931 [Monosiga brevicollis MX1]EDQ87887.1 predicted protein [Monosiga brevicollis MX1]|eukprot:XP_001747420.1 hypothetical protein [Monosiga brevicollis MX1]